MSVLFPAHPDCYYHSAADRLVTESSFLFGLKIVSMHPPHSHGYFSSAPGDTQKSPHPPRCPDAPQRSVRRWLCLLAKVTYLTNPRIEVDAPCGEED